MSIKTVINALLARLAPVIINLIGKYLTPGGTLSNICQWLYFYSFDFLLRQKGGRIKNYDIIEDPLIISRRRRPMASSFRAFESIENALKYWSSRLSPACVGSDKNEHLYLTGKAGCPDESTLWDFLLVGSPLLCPRDWHTPNYWLTVRDHAWQKVSLPNHWQLQGFDVPLYTNTGYPFQFDPPRARRNGKWVNTACDVGCGGTTTTGKHLLHRNELAGDNATGLFHRFFRLSEQWTGSSAVSVSERICIVFEGVDSCMTLSVNGQWVGYSQDSCLSAEFDITDTIHSVDNWQTATHSLAVQVSRWCDGSYLEDQDKWWLSGIYREVYLARRPAVAIVDYEYRARLMTSDDAAEVEVEVLIDDYLAVKSSDLSIRVELYANTPSTASVAGKESVPVMIATAAVQEGHTLEGRRLAESLGFHFHTAETEKVTAPHTYRAIVSGRVNHPALWTAETPHLYTLVVTLHSTLREAESNVKPLHLASSRVGIRSVTIDGPDHTLRVNGQTLTIAGINRHEFDPRTGRAVSEEAMREDAVLLKKLNFNAVRCSHYPNHSYWYEVCDEIGLYVIDEANIETHGFQFIGQCAGYLSRHPDWVSAMGSRVTRMYERDKNYPCIIGWSLGNESGFGPTHDNMAKWLRVRDPLRFVQYESGGSTTTGTDIICPMYLRPDWCRDQATTADAPLHRPVILCEYAHAMGNSGGCLAQYWRDFRNPALPRLQGGFIWDFKDQGLQLPSQGEGCFGYGGDFGDFPNTRQFCCNGIVGPDRTLHPMALEAAHLQSPVEVVLEREQQSLYDTLRVLNRRMHSSLDDLVLTVSPCCVSRMFQKNAIRFPSFEVDLKDFKVHAGEKVNIDISKKLDNSLKADEKLLQEAFADTSCAFQRVCWLDVSVRCKGDPRSSWNTEGFEVYHTALENYPLLEQKLSNLKHTVAVKSTKRTKSKDMNVELLTDTVSVSVKMSDGTFQDLPCVDIHWSNGSLATVCRVSGRLVRWTSPTSNGTNLLTSPVDVCLYRAATDNDRGGTIASYYARWIAAGLDSLIHAPQTNSIDGISTQSDGSIKVCCSFTLVPAAHASGRGTTSVHCSLVYSFSPSGAISISSKVIPNATLPPIPRCGVRFSVSGARFNSVSWFGAGPHENYSDRQESAYLGVFEKSVEEMHSHYLFPSECGHRIEPRWFVLDSKKTSRIKMAVSFNSDGTSTAGHGFSVNTHSMESLEAAAHDFELRDGLGGDVHVHIDGFMMGVGGYDSWTPNVDSEFLFQPDGLKSIETVFSLSM